MKIVVYQCPTSAVCQIDSLTCSNPTITSGSTKCDDDNKVSGDGCSATCNVETGYACPGSDVPICSPAHMDGLLIGNEECDDKNSNDTDGCSNTSLITDGWKCNSESPSVCV